ncbi:methyltransferase domain-containing protein [uncultured Chloroflexus sp.]|uniref:methyltransferase domain-containing protein n=1 Tax=uncultured Chloroflexus sp. TaxID=214040 RepID=UPI00260B68A5|nr:methyltransferase domain-containing protein [uncultured Chloroflexus sp.]
MDFKLLPYITCPCHRETPLRVEQIGRVVDGAIETGRLRCSHCATSYPIVDGILDLLGRQWPGSIAQFVNVLPLAAWAYERTWRPLALSILSGEQFPLERELTLITELAGVERGGLMIDVGCSNGLYARALEQARRRSGVDGFVVGIDLSLPMLQEARQRARRAGLHINFIRASAQALPFASGTASVLVMGGSLNEIGDIPAALAEWRRLLAPRGRGVMMSLAAASGQLGRTFQQALGSGGLQFPTLDELNQYVAQAGLQLRAQWQYGIVVFSVVQ